MWSIKGKREFCKTTGEFMSRLDAITDWAERAVLADYNPVKLARLCGVSASQLRRYFSEVFLQSPSDWLKELRLWHAAKLLCRGKSAKEVVWELKFGDRAVLYHQFKAYHGCSPGQFVQLHRRREAHLVVPDRDHTLTGIVMTEDWERAEATLCWKRRVKETQAAGFELSKAE